MSHTNVKKLILDDHANIERDINSFLSSLAADRGRPQLETKFFDRAFQDVYTSAFAQSGKHLRPLFAYWTARVLVNIDHVCVKRVATSVEVLHTASLVIDDIADGSEERRGAPAVYRKHGVPLALNTGSWLYFVALDHLQQKRLVQFANRVLMETHLGQGLDIQYSDTEFVRGVFDSSPLDRRRLYRRCAILKTGRLFQLASVAVAKGLNAPVHIQRSLFHAFGHFGTAFQIYDDIKNFLRPLSGSKTFEDLNSGLRNFVCLELMAQLAPFEVKTAMARFEDGELADFVIKHPALPTAMNAAQRYADNLFKKALTILSPLLKNNLICGEYLQLLLDSVTADIRAEMSQFLLSVSL